MKPGLQQHVGMRQDLRINPRLFQAMDLLYMPLLDLQQHLKQELLGNPFLEMVETEEEPEESQTTTAEKEKAEKEKQGDDEPNWEEILLDDGAEAMAGRRDLSEAREYTRARLGRGTRPLGPPQGPGPDAGPDPSPAAARRGVPRQHRRGRIPRRDARGDRHRREQDARGLRGEAGWRRGGPALYDARSRRDAADHPDPRSARRGRPRPARMPAAPARGQEADRYHWPTVW